MQGEGRVEGRMQGGGGWMRGGRGVEGWMQGGEGGRKGGCRGGQGGRSNALNTFLSSMLSYREVHVGGGGGGCRDLASPRFTHLQIHTHQHTHTHNIMSPTFPPCSTPQQIPLSQDSMPALWGVGGGGGGNSRTPNISLFPGGDNQAYILHRIKKDKNLCIKNKQNVAYR